MSESNMYKCRHFVIQELVSEAVYAKYGEAAWRFLDPTAMRGIDALRDKYGSCTINNWHTGGSFSFSGLRASEEYPKSSVVSGHRHGKAFDLKFSGAIAGRVQSDIHNGRTVIEGLTELELGTSTWTHVAFNTNVTGILTYRA